MREKNKITPYQLRKNGWKKGNDWSWYFRLNEGIKRALLYKEKEGEVMLLNVFANYLRKVNSIDQLNLLVKALTE